VAQHRNDILERHGVEVVHLPYQIHPEIPVDGVEAGPRVGAMYANLEREAAAAGLPLNWPARLSNTRRALSDATAATWLAEAELAGSEAGVRATPGWLAHGRLISGLLPPAEFERIAESLGDN